MYRLSVIRYVIEISRGDFAVSVLIERLSVISRLKILTSHVLSVLKLA